MQSLSRQPVGASVEKRQQRPIEQLINKTKKMTLFVENKIQVLEDQQDTYLFRYKTYIEFSEQSADPNMERKLEIQNQLKQLIENRKEVLDQIKELLEHCETFLSILVQEITIWQRLSCIGANTNSLEQIEAWVTEIVKVFLQLKCLLGILSELSEKVPYDGDPLTDPQQLMQRLLAMLRCLVQKSFVVDKQPVMTEHLNHPLVVKTRTQFCVRARDPPNIKGYRRFKLSGPDAKTMEDSQQEGLVVEYKYLQLKAEQAGKRVKGGKGATDGSSTVMEELHIITLMTQVEYEGVNLILEAATLPFVVISHLSQLVGAFASVLWFNLLSSDPKDVTFFSKPPAAPWSQLAEALSWQFSCCTERGLDSDQQEMLREKLCGNIPQEDCIVTWKKFAKKNMPKCEFTFWVWFHAVVDLVKTHLENIWNVGYVMGFVSRSRAEALLKTMQQGTFLLRFSESLCDGGITWSYVDHQPHGTYNIHSVDPFKKKELKEISFTECIRTYHVFPQENLRENPLKYLYPNIPKDEAFGPYYKQTSKDEQGYRKRRLIMVSESLSNDSHVSTASGTPLHYPETPHNDHSISVDGLKVTKEDISMDQLLNGSQEQTILVDSVQDNIHIMHPNTIFVPFGGRTESSTEMHNACGWIQSATIPVSSSTSSKVDDSQTSISSGTTLHYTETTHTDHSISVNGLEVPTEEDLSIDQLLNEIHMEDFLMHPNFDPMISSLSGEYYELSLTSDFDQ
ncbi:signal transducer and activator of transcription 2-like isoform X2 [Pseudophryne corroboree]|uniref:signal transducer and activator of transcription 2-like isoform X2 n=1 Tax=Pseudophryne corroboree TaxID=495146 RepID=UPI003081A67D